MKNLSKNSKITFSRFQTLYLSVSLNNSYITYTELRNTDITFIGMAYTIWERYSSGICYSAQYFHSKDTFKDRVTMM